MILVVVHGAVAQLVAHLHGMQGVRGSSPLSSTRGRARSSDRALSLCGVRSVCSALGVECARCGVHHVECAMWSALRRDDASSPCHVSPLVLTRAASPRSRIRGPPEDRAARSSQLAACRSLSAVCRRLFAAGCSPSAARRQRCWLRRRWCRLWLAGVQAREVGVAPLAPWRTEGPPARRVPPRGRGQHQDSQHLVREIAMMPASV